jgi:rubredoxin-NAD+ reductase
VRVRDRPPRPVPGAPVAAGQMGQTDKYRCKWCGYVYDPAKGEAARGTAPGTRFEDLPDDWCCPDCRAPLADFERIAD